VSEEFKMRWIITKDVIENGADEGVMSRAGSPREGFPSEKFRMFDDDGELYYEGMLNKIMNLQGLNHLDDFGMPNAGCTEIQYFEKGKWNTL
jgi:hypothetical protein